MSGPSITEPEPPDEPQASARRPRLPLPRFHPPSPSALRGLVVAVALALVVVLLAAVLVHAGGSRPTTAAAPTPTATALLPTATSAPAGAAIVPGPQLAWRSAAYPWHACPMSVLVVAPSNGDVAYACVENDSGPNAHIYVTRNGGATWSAGGGLPVGAQPSERYSLECYIMADSNNPATVVIVAGWVENGTPGMRSEFSNYATFDYGVHWANSPTLSPSSSPANWRAIRAAIWRAIRAAITRSV